MSSINLNKKLQEKNIGGVFLFYGEEQYELERAVDKIKKSFNTNLESGINYFELDNANIDSIFDLAESVSFFGEEKLIIVKDINLKLDIEALMRRDLSKITIVFIEKQVDKRQREYKYLDKNAVCVEFTKLKQSEVIKYTITTLSKYKINVSQQVAEYFIEAVSNDKLIIINEFKKLVSILNAPCELTIKDIDLICAKTLSSKIFDMLDLALAKKKIEASNKLNQLFEQKEAAVKIAGMMFKNIKQMYMIKILEEKERVTNTRIDKMSYLKIAPFTYTKLQRIINLYTKDSLEKIINNFDEYDRASKIGDIDMEKGLELIIMEM